MTHVERTTGDVVVVYWYRYSLGGFSVLNTIQDTITDKRYLHHVWRGGSVLNRTLRLNLVLFWHFDADIDMKHLKAHLSPLPNNVELVIYCKSITMNKGVHLNPKGHILFSPYKDAQNSSLLKALAWSICKNLAFALMFSVV